jgi:hypothetical protein
VDRDSDLTELVVTGKVTAQDILEVISTCYTGEPTLKVLWDFNEAALDQVDVRKVKPLAQASQRFAAGRAGGKTALVFSSASAYGMGRLFDQLRQASDSPVAYKSFQDRASALAWLEGSD